MVEPIRDLPAGLLGFRITAKLERDEYHDTLMAPIYAALERGEKVRLLVELPAEFEGLDAGALWEDLKAAGSVGLKHRPAWERFALVTDKDWVKYGASAFGSVTCACAAWRGMARAIAASSATVDRSLIRIMSASGARRSRETRARQTPAPVRTGRVTR